MPRTILSQVKSLHISNTTDIFIQESSSDDNLLNLHDLEFNDHRHGALFTTVHARTRRCSEPQTGHHSTEVVHEEVVDLVDVVRLLDEHDEFLLFETR